MTTKLLSPAVPRRRLVSVLIAAIFSLTLALNPMSTSQAHAEVPVKVRVHAMYVATAQIGIRYTWGGMSRSTGFDCSGLTKYSYGVAGRYVPRTAAQQYRASIHIPARSASAGDLVFFYTGSNVYHVGIYVGRGLMIHAPRTGKRIARVHIWTSHVLYGRVR